ncbi:MULTISPECIES: isocitrate lyase/PEP mutase family protein [Streptomyces]|uniref:isocitrate lyase/PEP mutase family protein n=1 Tax=Streptomyces TaxID=1883 RepID=UPI000B9E4662|nr:isocitrate lyase/phosphoenolpyruvate mutase family protein [Streptomyces kasugaensis]
MSTSGPASAASREPAFREPGTCASVSHTSVFHALHHADGPLLLPNAWDVASAVALAGAGYAAIGTTSLGVAAAHGLPDGQGLAEVGDATLALARRLGERLPCPYTMDIEGGFGGGAERVAGLAAEVAAAGAAGINLEDGLPGGGGLQVPSFQAELIRAVKERVPGLFLNARIDTHWLVDAPPPLSVTLARAETYLAAGADGIFVPGVVADEDVSALVAAVPAPLNILFAPGRHTVSRLAELGVRRISTGSLLFRTALGATLAAAESVRTGQEPGGAAGAGYGVPGYAEVQRLAGEGSGGER